MRLVTSSPAKNQFFKQPVSVCLHPAILPTAAATSGTCSSVNVRTSSRTRSSSMRPKTQASIQPQPPRQFGGAQFRQPETVTTKLGIASVGNEPLPRNAWLSRDFSFRLWALRRKSARASFSARDFKSVQRRAHHAVGRMLVAQPRRVAEQLQRPLQNHQAGFVHAHGAHQRMFAEFFNQRSFARR